MKWQQYHKSTGILLVLICQTGIIFSGLSSRLLAQPDSMKISLEFPPTNERGAPRTTTGGGTRGNSCIDLSGGDRTIPLTPLMPTRTNVGITATTTPVLYWYIPQNTAKSGEFSLEDEVGNEVYRVNFKLPPTPGIVKLKVPSDAALKTNRNYQWKFSLVCNPQNPKRNQWVSGVLQPQAIDLSLKQQLANKEPLERAEFYAQQRIWHETLDIMAQLSTENPAEWTEFLKSIDLESIAKKPILECCTPKN